MYPKWEHLFYSVNYLCFPLASNFHVLQYLGFVYYCNTPLYIYLADLFKLNSIVSWI